MGQDLDLCDRRCQRGAPVDSGQHHSEAAAAVRRRTRTAVFLLRAAAEDLPAPRVAGGVGARQENSAFLPNILPDFCLLNH